MAWVRLDDSAMGNLKIVRLADSAFRLWVKGLCYCQMHLTDGLIHSEALVPMAAKKKDIDQLCSVLVDGKAPLWRPVTGGYQVHDYLDYNDSAEDVRERQRKDRARKRKQADPPDGIPSGVPDGIPSGPARAFPFCSVPLESSSEKTSAEHSEPAPRPVDDDRRRVPERRASSGAMAGALPRDHVKHAECSPNFAWCVPLAVHDKLVSLVSPRHGGDRQVARDALVDWYREVWSKLPADFVMGDAFRFWQQQFDADQASKTGAPTSKKPSEPSSKVPAIDVAAMRNRYQAEGGR